jgi:hypothetical protein
LNIDMTRKQNSQIKGLAHHLPHRTRYRVSSRHRNEKAVHRIRDSVLSVAGVKSVEINDRTGSVLVHHDETPGILDALAGALDAVGEDLFDEIIESGINEVIPGGSVFAHLIRQRIGRADSLVAELTNNLLDLKMLLPICFLGAGFFQASRNRDWLGQVPAWVLFYYAYDSYLKFHGPAALRLDGAQAAGNGPILKLKSSGGEGR